jgi:hypothetical protein
MTIDADNYLKLRENLWGYLNGRKSKSFHEATIKGPGFYGEFVLRWCEYLEDNSQHLNPPQKAKVRKLRGLATTSIIAASLNPSDPHGKVWPKSRSNRQSSSTAAGSASGHPSIPKSLHPGSGELASTSHQADAKSQSRCFPCISSRSEKGLAARNAAAKAKHEVINNGPRNFAKYCLGASTSGSTPRR